MGRCWPAPGLGASRSAHDVGPAAVLRYQQSKVAAAPQAILVALAATGLLGMVNGVTIAYTGMRWGETIGLERDLLFPSLINVEWQLREIGGAFHRLPPVPQSSCRRCR